MRRNTLYGSYTDKSSEVLQTGASVMRERVRNAVVIVLALVIVALGVFGGQAIAYRAQSREMFAETMLNECNDALSLANSLSRTAGANSSTTLGRIRSGVHTMDMINRLHNSLDGRYFVPDTTFSELYTILDNYASRLITGLNTGDMQGELQSALEALQTLLAEL